MVNIYDKSDQSTKAIEACEQAVHIYPEDAGAWHNLGYAYGESGQPTKAIEAFRQAVRIDPENAKA